MVGTAYVVNWTSRLVSNRSIARSSPIEPTCEILLWLASPGVAAREAAHERHVPLDEGIRACSFPAR